MANNEQQQTDGSTAAGQGIGHKAILDLNLTFQTEADLDSEAVKTFLKAVEDVAKAKRESGGRT